MNTVKKYLGIVWLLMGPALFIMLLLSAVKNISGEVKGDISNPIPCIIILCIFLPIAAGLSIFGWYALREEFGNIVCYDNEEINKQSN